MRKRRKLLDWEREAIFRAVVDGEKKAALAAEFDISPSAISMMLLRERQPPVARRRYRLPRYADKKRDWLLVRTAHA